jgi:LPXTG-site transpeptidase (sortase) family protein
MASLVRDIATPGIHLNHGQLPRVEILPSRQQKRRKLKFKAYGIKPLAIASLVSTATILSLIVVSGLLRTHYLVQHPELATPSIATAQVTANGEPAPDESPVTSAQHSAYTVAPDAPRFLRISKLGIDSRVMALGTLKNGQLATPRNIYDTGWYTSSSKPGQAGATLIAGHMTGVKNYGVFTNLNKLVPGDLLTISRGDGQIISYKVVTKKQVPLPGVDMASLMVPIVAGKPGLNLITCAGSFVDKTNTFTDRLLIYATQI